MRVLIGCETSGIVRRAFSYAGHEAWSVDVLPAEDGSNMHIVGDVRDQLDKGWDLLAVMHPPCTRLCNAGVRWLRGAPPPGKTKADMWAELDAACELFSACWTAPIPRVCVENPIMHGHARERIADYRDPVTVQPHWFGEPESKGISLYLRGLPALRRTHWLRAPAKGTPEHKAWHRVHNATGWRTASMEPRWKERSRFFPGVAQAMADQWGRVADPEHFELVG